MSTALTRRIQRMSRHPMLSIAEYARAFPGAWTAALEAEKDEWINRGWAAVPVSPSLWRIAAELGVSDDTFGRLRKRYDHSDQDVYAGRLPAYFFGIDPIFQAEKLILDVAASMGGEYGRIQLVGDAPYSLQVKRLHDPSSCGCLCHTMDVGVVTCQCFDGRYSTSI